MRYWTTTDRPVAEQFSYWREVICEAFTPLATERRAAHRPPGPRDPGITSWVRSTPLTGINCAEVVSATQLITHGLAEVRRTRTDQVFVNLQLRGDCIASQGGRDCVVSPGGFAMFDTTSEYRLEFIGEPQSHEWHVVSFRVPRAQLIPLLADPHGFTSVAHTARGGVARIVASTMMSIWDNALTLDRSGAAAADTAFTALLAAAAGGGDMLRDTRREQLDAALRASINRYLTANVRHGDVSARRVAAQFGVSLRKLHGVYEGTGRTFSQTVMALRIEGCAQQLASGAGPRYMTELASSWGFSDLSHLNRVFRAHYGHLPSEHRKATQRTGGWSTDSHHEGAKGRH